MTNDVAKAREIVSRRRAWVGQAGALRKNIEAAVVEGIALGRQQGLAYAVKLLQDATEESRHDLMRIEDATFPASNMKAEDWVRKS